MRVLLVSSFAFPHLGGLSTYMKLLKNGLEARGHYVEVLSLNQGSTRYRLLKQGKSIDKRVLDNYIIRNNYRSFRQQVSGMPDFIRNNELTRREVELAARRFGVSGFDVIHSQDITAAMAMAKLGLKNTKLITTTHGCMAGEFLAMAKQQRRLSPWVWRYVYIMERSGVRAADRVIVPALWLKRFHVNTLGVPQGRLVPVAHGAPTWKFTSKSSRLISNSRLKDKSRRTGAPVILNAQRLDKGKGHRYMIRALASLKKYRWKAYIAGSGNLRTSLERLRNQSGLRGRVTFLGKRSDVPSLLSEADIVIVPSLMETFPFAALEAQVAGKPVVGFRTTGVSEIVAHGKTGLLAPLGNSAKLAEHVRTLLANPSLRRRMGKAARTRALSKWTIRHMIDHTIQVYRTAPKGVRNIPPDNLLQGRVTAGHGNVAAAQGNVTAAQAKSRLKFINSIYS